MRNSRVRIAGCFLISGMLVLLSKLTCSETLLHTVEETAGTVICAGGRVRPHELFGRLKAEKVGSHPPDLTFFPR